MILVLVLLSLVLLLFAAAIELWWGSAARRQQRNNLVHIEQSLAGAPRAAPAMASRAPASSSPRRSERQMDALLLRAGLPTGWRVPVMLAAPSLVLAIAAWLRLGSVLAVPLVLGVYAAVAWLWLRTRIEKQRAKILRQLPDFLDGMVRLASIGNSLPMAFQATSNTVQMPLRAVLDRTMQSVRTGQDLDHALQLASQPYRLDALDLLYVILGTGMRMGGRTDQILQRMSDFMRDLGHARQELHAITSETRLSAWVLGLLPLVVAVFMTLVNPDFFTPMFSQPLGHRILLIALGMEALGAFLLYRLAKSL